MTAHRTVQLPPQRRDASFVPSTYDAKARTIEVVWSTGARVGRFDWWTGKRYDEELSMDPAHCKLDRLASGRAPLLDSHNRWQLGDVIGVVRKAWLENGEGRALVEFSAREEIAPLIDDVARGIVANISIGYSVREYEITKRDGAPELWRAVDWEPFEISFVPVGADPDAGSRSHQQRGAQAPSVANAAPCVLITRAPAAHIEEQDMTTAAAAPAGITAKPGENTEVRDPAAPPAPAASQEALARAADEAAKAERTRAIEIRKAVRALDLGDDVADKLIEEGVSLETARARIIDLAAEKSAATRVHAQAKAGDQHPVIERRAAAVNALLHRYQPAEVKLEERAREFRGMGLIDLARDCCEAAGIRTRGMTPFELAAHVLSPEDHRSTRTAGPAMGTSDFANILLDVANKTLRRGYETAPRTFPVWARRSTARDFKNINRVQFGDAPVLRKVGPGGEFTYGAMKDAKEVYALATYGRIVAFTRQAIVNDDLDAFTRIPQLFGFAAASLESDTVYAVINDNAAMGDGTALFHANHGNLAAANAAIDVASVGIGRNAMRIQKGLSADASERMFISVSPRTLLVPTTLETKAEQFVSTNLVPEQFANENPFKGKLIPLAEPRLNAVASGGLANGSDTAWYLVADSAQVDTLEYAYLEGQEGVFLDSRIGFNVDGMEVKARLDFAAKAIDWVGFFKNAGA